jgi:hypothetical protein
MAKQDMVVSGGGMTTITIELTEREVATIAAALRNWQTDALNEDMEEGFWAFFQAYPPLDGDQIDELSERLLRFAGL